MIFLNAYLLQYVNLIDKNMFNRAFRMAMDHGIRCWHWNGRPKAIILGNPAAWSHHQTVNSITQIQLILQTLWLLIAFWLSGQTQIHDKKETHCKIERIKDDSKLECQFLFFFEKNSGFISAFSRYLLNRVRQCMWLFKKADRKID